MIQLFVELLLAFVKLETSHYIALSVIQDTDNKSILSKQRQCQRMWSRNKKVEKKWNHAFILPKVRYSTTQSVNYRHRYLFYKAKKTPPKLYFLQDLLPTKLQLFELPSHDSVCSFGFHTTSLPVTCIRSEFHKRVAIPILIKDGVKFPDSSHNLARFWFVLARNVIGIVQGKVKCGHFKIKVTFLRGCVKRK